jgi:hypothetical protein
MCAVDCRIKSCCAHPSTYHPGVLPGRKMRGRRQSTREEVLLRSKRGLVESRADCRPGRLSQVELHGTLCLSLNDLRPG